MAKLSPLQTITPPSHVLAVPHVQIAAALLCLSHLQRYIQIPSSGNLTNACEGRAWDMRGTRKGHVCA